MSAPGDPVRDPLRDSARDSRSQTRHADAVRAAARLAKVSGSALAEIDLTLPQYRVLVFLDSGGRPASDVATLLDVAPSTVTSVVDGLCARGLVLRGEDPDDRRRVVLSLTAEGKEMVTTGDSVVAERLGKLLDRLPRDEADAALAGLESLNSAMEDYLTEKFGRPHGTS
ncbi:MAG: MarR family winged helix-turn-helix transcriptional regulator [Microthrixaceae bacterium]|nr:MarR family winged helix-turn-helix transcriptional regulator [Microthrixaceae bacterium]